MSAAICRGALAVVFALATSTVLAGCSGQDSESEGPRRTAATGSEETTIEPRRFQPLDSDQAKGPRHQRPLPAEPTQDELEAAAQDGPGRREAETFAILVNHALKDQTPGSRGDSVIIEFGDRVPADSLASIEETRSFPGNRIVPGGRSFVRSAVTGTPTVDRATVYVVEKIAGPDLFQANKLFVSWSQTTLTLAWSGTQWQVIDYQDAAASEYPKFSTSTWRGTMDSGHGWRRFDVAK